MAQETHSFEKEQKKLELGELECCALANAFAKNRDAVAKLLELDKNNILKKSADILVRSKNLSFPHNDTQIAQAELKCLDGLSENDKAGFRCHHNKKEHRLVLESVVIKTQTPAN